LDFSRNVMLSCFRGKRLKSERGDNTNCPLPLRGECGDSRAAADAPGIDADDARRDPSGDGSSAMTGTITPAER
jgi:hypothetical protein